MNINGFPCLADYFGTCFKRKSILLSDLPRRAADLVPGVRLLMKGNEVPAAEATCTYYTCMQSTLLRVGRVR